MLSVAFRSIHSKSSITPLQISRDALQALKNTYKIGDELWDLTSTFGDKPMSAAVGEGAMKVQSGENGIQGGRFPDPIHVPKGPKQYFRSLLQTQLSNAGGSSELDYAPNGCFSPA